MIEAKNLTFQYRFARVAFRNVSFCADKNKPLILLGDKEAGKTSLLNALCDTTERLKGELLFDGKVCNLKERDISFFREKSNFFTYHSVAYNIKYPLSLRKQTLLPYRFIPKSLENRKICTLNHEEKLAVLMERIYQRQANNILLDDPFKVFPEPERKRIFDIYFPFLQELIENHTVVFATSSLYEAEKFQKEITFMSYGYFIQTGKIEEIRKKPETLSCYLFFHPDITPEEILITPQNIDVTQLLHPIYIGQTVYKVTEGRNTLLYDPSSDRLIYH